ncbi:MAG: tetratricopeptide repeat protein [Bacteroidota bacterium]
MNDQLSAVLSENDRPFLANIIEGHKGQPFAHELLTDQQTYQDLVLLYLFADVKPSARWYANSASGKRREIEGDRMALEQLGQLKLVVLQGGIELSWVEQFLFAGAKTVMVLPSEDDRSLHPAASPLFEAFLQGKTLKEAVSLSPDALGLSTNIIPSDLYEYWSFKESMEGKSMAPGLYCLSASTDALDQWIVDPALVPEKAPEPELVVEPGISQEKETEEKPAEKSLPVPPSAKGILPQKESILRIPKKEEPKLVPVFLSTQDARKESESRSYTISRSRENRMIKAQALLWNEYYGLEQPEEHPQPKTKEAEKPTVKEPKAVKASKAAAKAARTETAPTSENELVAQLLHNYRQSFTLTPPSRSYSKAIAVISLIVVMTIMYVTYSWKNQRPELVQDIASPLYSQVFETTKTYNVLLMPFESHMNCKADEAIAESMVRDRLNGLRESEDLGIRVSFLNQGICPRSQEEARSLGEQHNADIVIWGNYDHLPESKEEVSLRYVSMYDAYTGVDVWLGDQIGKQALGDRFELQNGAFKGKPDEVVYWILGLVHLNFEEYQSAIGYLQQIDIRDETEHAIIHHLQAKCYQGLKKYEDVLVEYNEAICLNPMDANAYHGRGKTYQRLKKHQLAISDFGQALRIDPDHVRAYQNRKLLLNRTKGLDPRIESLLGPAKNDVNSYASVKVPSLRQPKPAKKEVGKPSRKEQMRAAMVSPRSVIASNDVPEKKPVVKNMPSVWEKRKARLEKSVKHYSALIKDNPGHVDYYYLRGKAFKGLGQLDRSARDYSQVLRLQPSNKEVFLERAELYVGMKKYDLALTDYGNAIHLDENAADMYASRANLLRQMGRYSNAEADAKKALGLDPANRDYLRLLGDISTERMGY